MFVQKKIRVSPYLWLFVIGLAIVDLGIRHGKVIEWTPLEMLAYLISIVMSGMWTMLLCKVLARWLFDKKWLLFFFVAAIGIVSALTYLSSYRFYFIFRNIPNIVTLRFVLEETTEALSFVEADMLTLGGGAAVSLVFMVIWYWLIDRYHQQKQRGFPVLNLLGLLILAPMAHNNIWLMQGNTMPGVNMAFSITKSLEKFFGNEGNIRVLQVRHIPPLPQLGEAPPFNVILIVNESLRASSNSFYGYSRITSPRQDEFLQKKYRNHSFIFQRAYSNSTNTHLSFPSILTGILPGQSHQDLHSMPTFYEYGKMFSNYKTFLISSHSHQYGNFQLFIQSPYLDKWWNRDIGKKEAFNTYGADDRFVAQEFVNFLNDPDLDEQPFFGVLQFNGTHFPYHVPEEFRIWTKKTRYTDDYDNSIRYVDHWVGKVLSELEQRGLLKNTVIISTSDHGDGFGEHKDEFGHLQSFYDEGTRVPFWVYLPEMLQQYKPVLQKNINTTIHNVDIVPSVLDLLALSNHKALQDFSAKLKGKSIFSPIPDDRYIVMQNMNSYYTSQFAGIGVVRDQDKFLFKVAGQSAGMEYYNLADDPLEKNDLSGQIPADKLADLKNFLRQDPFLRKWLKQWFFQDL
ncbi:MAG: sulfatase [SAR324 cluster bacterium]|nr:sulfatase [SAR324 cluster bacterium]